jgi:ABC-2 type transport system permease protein
MKAKMLTQIKREFWECRSSFIKTPLVTTGILVVLLVLGVAPWHYKIAGFISQSSVSYTGNSNLGFEVLEEAAGHQSITTDPGYLVHGLTAVFSVFAVILLLVLLFYFADTLYSDRRDQSVLFWKSMPVSESETVLSKLIAGVIGAPAVYVGAALLTGALFTLSFLIYAGSVWKIPVPELGSVVPIFLKCALGLIFGWIVLALWYLPLFSWLLFSSAFVRKTPFMLALGLPLALIVAEKWVLGSHQLFRVLRDQIGAGLYNFGVLVQDPAALPHRITDALSASQFLLGLLVSAVFLSACVWLRNNRWEI